MISFIRAFRDGSIHRTRAPRTNQTCTQRLALEPKLVQNNPSISQLFSLWLPPSIGNDTHSNRFIAAHAITCSVSANSFILLCLSSSVVRAPRNQYTIKQIYGFSLDVLKTLQAWCGPVLHLTICDKFLYKAHVGDCNCKDAKLLLHGGRPVTWQ